ncbi:unnamed protein product [Protopolystoma xenopodis]|uniref:Uncharacterized protein n=1 Tax=Protopolystoma xenopodis TaxID=117903 RepID=A0A448XES0_9PLAT|nr:unnamed protein product [Protopolystoma xenopodis]
MLSHLSVRLLQSRCASTKTTKKCTGASTQISTTVREELVAGKCRAIKSVNQTNLMAKKLCINKVIQSQCYPGRKTYTKTILAAQMENCRCGKPIRKTQVCDCACPKVGVFTQCLPTGQIVVTTIKANNTGCRCSINKMISKSMPVCPPTSPIPQVSECRETAGKPLQTVTRQKAVIDRKKCTCSLQLVRQMRPCVLQAKREVKKRCLRGSLMETLTTELEYVASKNKTIRVPVRREVSTITCGRPEAFSSCVSASGAGVLTERSYTLSNCTCVARLERKAIKCACNPLPRIVNVSECNQKTCRIQTTYVKEAMDATGKCRRLEYSSVKSCCCLPDRKEQRCSVAGDRLIVQHTSYSLGKADTCSRHLVTTWTRVVCPERLLPEEHCDPATRRLSRTTSQLRARRCNCTKVLLHQSTSECGCRAPEVWRFCDKVNWRIVLHETVYRLTAGRCQKKSTQRIKPVSCRSDEPKRVKEVCDPLTGQSRIQITETVVSLDDGCRCVKERRVRWLPQTGCSCVRPKQAETTKCSNGQLLVTRNRSVLVGGRCQTQQITESRPIVCNPNLWTLQPPAKSSANASRCGIQVFIRSVPRNCKCVRQVRTQKCDCSCRLTPKPQRSCARNGLVWLERQYFPRMENCRCLNIFKDVVKPIVCPRATVVVSDCEAKSCNRITTSVTYSVENCTCIPVTRTVVAKCCCPKGDVKTTCLNNLGLIETVVKTPKLDGGKCVEQTTRRQMRFNCDRLNANSAGCQPIGVCDAKTGTQSYRCKKFTRVGCKCRPSSVIKPGLCRKSYRVNRVLQVFSNHAIVKIDH